MPEPSDMTTKAVLITGAASGLVEVEDVARMIAYLVSPAAKGIHGACINFDNGITVG